MRLWSPVHCFCCRTEQYHFLQCLIWLVDTFPPDVFTVINLMPSTFVWPDGGQKCLNSIIRTSVGFLNCLKLITSKLLDISILHSCGLRNPSTWRNMAKHGSISSTPVPTIARRQIPLEFSNTLRSMPLVGWQCIRCRYQIPVLVQDNPFESGFQPRSHRRLN